jgi:hypothetical protein
VKYDAKLKRTSMIQFAEPLIGRARIFCESRVHSRGSRAG